MVVRIRITQAQIEAYEALDPKCRTWHRDNPMARAIHDRLRPTYLWMTSKDTLIREFFYHDEAVQEWLKAHFRGDKVKPITIQILDDDGLRIVKA